MIISYRTRRPSWLTSLMLVILLLLVLAVSTVVQVTALPAGFNLVHVSQYVDRSLRNLWAEGDYLYVVADYDADLIVYNIADRARPYEVGRCDIGGGLDIIVRGTHAYITGNQYNSVEIVDISNPHNPVLVGSTVNATSLKFAHGGSLSPSGDYFYVAAQSYGFTIVDVSVVTAPVVRGTLSGGGQLPGGITSLHDVVVSSTNSSVVYASSHSDYVMAIDVTNPDNPNVLSSVNVQVAFSDIRQVGNYIYSGGAGAGGAYAGQSWLISFDVSDPNNIAKVGEMPGTAAYWIDPISSWRGVLGSYLAIADASVHARIVDIGDPASMSIIESWTDSNVVTNLRNVFVYGDYIYFTATYVSGGRVLVFGPDHSPPDSPYTPSWYSTNYTRRMVLSFNTGNISSNLTNFPVRVVLNASNFDFSTNVTFVDKDDITPLTYDVEKWDSGNRRALIWVSVPQIDRFSAYSDYFYMYYGDPTLASASNPTVVWNNAVAVWHLSSNFTSSTGSHDLAGFGGPTFSDESVTLNGVDQYLRNNNLMGTLYDEMTYIQWTSLPSYGVGATKSLWNWARLAGGNYTDSSVGQVDNSIRTTIKFSDGVSRTNNMAYTPSVNMTWGVMFDSNSDEIFQIKDGEPYSETPIAPASGNITPNQFMYIGVDQYGSGGWTAPTVAHTVLYPTALTFAELYAEELNRRDELLYYGGLNPTPSVITQVATDVTGNSYHLNSNLTSLGAVPTATVYFEYGPTRDLGNTTDDVTVDTTGTFDATLPTPSADNIIYYRGVGTNSHGTVYGAILVVNIPSATGGLLLKSLLRVLIASVILVGVILVGTRGSGLQMLVSSVVGVTAFVIIDAFITTLF